MDRAVAIGGYFGTTSKTVSRKNVMSAMACTYRLPDTSTTYIKAFQEIM